MRLCQFNSGWKLLLGDIKAMDLKFYA